MKRYPKDIISYPGISRLSLAMSLQWILSSLVYPMSKHLRIIKRSQQYKMQSESAKIQPELCTLANSSTSPSSARRFIVSWQRGLSQQAARQPRRRGSPPQRPSRQPPPLPGRGMALAGDGCPSPVAMATVTARCRRRRLDAVTKFELPWRRNSARVVTQEDVALHTSHCPEGRLAYRRIRSLLE